jgi:hypothetical protein
VNTAEKYNLTKIKTLGNRYIFQATFSPIYIHQRSNDMTATKWNLVIIKEIKAITKHILKRNQKNTIVDQRLCGVSAKRSSKNAFECPHFLTN